KWISPNQRQTTSFDRLRGSAGLRRWNSNDIVPEPDDEFQERLYCIRWMDPKTGERHYRAPASFDLESEAYVIAVIQDRFADWQTKGFIPRRRIEPGKDINRPTNARGWTY